MTAHERALDILLPTDVFPPRCGGAGWSAHALSLALIGRGHRVLAVVPRRGMRGAAREDVLGVPALRWGYPAPGIPFVQNYFRHERLWGPLAGALRREAAHAGPATTPHAPLIIHAQHVQVTPAAVLAGQSLGAPVVVTVRDHWPWDYFATGLHGDQVPYGAASWASLAADLPARLGPLRGVAALPAIPYMLAHLRRRQSFLRQASAVIAPSRYIAGRLRELVAAERIHVIPHMVDLAAIDRVIARPPQSVAPDEPFLLFVGKLERNKGAHLLPGIFRALLADGRRQANGIDGRWSVVIAGDGPLRAELERELGELGAPARFLAWADHDEVLRLMARCALLLFPSAWGEPLSRVLLEACACGSPILAMPTGGTPDIIEDGVSGALEPTVAGFARRMSALLADPARRRALGDGARRRARERFAHEVVVGQVEKLYRDLLRDTR